MLPALKLDHETGPRPVGVDKEAVDEDVQLRERQASLADEVEEPGLEVGFGLDCLSRVVIE